MGSYLAPLETISFITIIAHTNPAFELFLTGKMHGLMTGPGIAG